MVSSPFMTEVYGQSCALRTRLHGISCPINRGAASRNTFDENRPRYYCLENTNLAQSTGSVSMLVTYQRARFVSLAICWSTTSIFCLMFPKLTFRKSLWNDVLIYTVVTKPRDCHVLQYHGLNFDALIGLFDTLKLDLAQHFCSLPKRPLRLERFLFMMEQSLPFRNPHIFAIPRAVKVMILQG